MPTIRSWWALPTLQHLKLFINDLGLLYEFELLTTIVYFVGPVDGEHAFLLYIF
ncbi:hypothetical protein NUACC26_056910 [Scytonema sp. NUACC26]